MDPPRCASDGPPAPEVRAGLAVDEAVRNLARALVSMHSADVPGSLYKRVLQLQMAKSIKNDTHRQALARVARDVATQKRTTRVLVTTLDRPITTSRCSVTVVAKLGAPSAPVSPPLYVAQYSTRGEEVLETPGATRRVFHVIPNTNK